MAARRAAAGIFFVLCLGLSGLVLHRQIAAHPFSAESAQGERPDIPGEAFLFGLPVNKQTWHRAAPPIRSAACSTIQNQLTAFRHGDGDKAMSYQTRSTRSNYRSPAQFVHAIVRLCPEFGHARSVQFGELWLDPTEQFADITVTVRGENGRRAQGSYMMIREEGVYRVASVPDAKTIP